MTHAQSPTPHAPTLNVGIIGSGYMGRTYAECLERYNTNARLAGVAGGTRAPGLAADYGVPAEPSVEALVARADVDAVIIASPPSAHRAQVAAAAAAGKHVLLEKPMAATVADCEAMIAACQAAGVWLSVIKPWHYRGPGREAGRVIREGHIGQVRMLQMYWLACGLPFSDKPWIYDPREGGMLADAGSHCFDFLRWAAQSEPTRVCASVTRYGGTDQSAMAQIDFASGAMASLWLSYEMPRPGFDHSIFRTRVVGENGILDVDGFGALRLGRDDSWETVHEQPPIDAIGRMYEWSRMEAFVLLVQDFIDAVLANREPPVTGFDGLAAIAMVDASYRSAESGEAIRLDLRQPAAARP